MESSGFSEFCDFRSHWREKPSGRTLPAPACLGAEVNTHVLAAIICESKQGRWLRHPVFSFIMTSSAFFVLLISLKYFVHTSQAVVFAEHCPHVVLFPSTFLPGEAVAKSSTPSFLKPALDQHFLLNQDAFRDDAATFADLGIFQSSRDSALFNAVQISALTSCLHLFSFKHLARL